MTRMMVDKPNRFRSKPHAENFRQTFTSPNLPVKREHRRSAKRSFQSRGVRGCSLELCENALPIAIGGLMYSRQCHDIDVGWLQSIVLEHEFNALIRKPGMILFPRRSLFLQRD